MKTAIDKYLQKHGFEAFAPKAVLFDMDGVIYNSMPNHAVSWHESMKQVGLQMPPADAYRYEGMRGVETIKLLAEQQWHRQLSDQEAQQLYNVKSARFAQCPPARKMRNIKPLMRLIKASGMKICVVTGSGQPSLLTALARSFRGLISPELIVSSFDVEHGKPAPDPYLMGMQKAGVAPWETIVVENAPLGVRAAVAARCFTIAVNTGPLPDSELSQEGADMVFPTITALYQQWPFAAAESLPSIQQEASQMADGHKQEASWQRHYEQIVAFVKQNKRRPSKYADEERGMVNWLKSNRKLINKGALSAHRVAQFQQLTVLLKRYQRINQHGYVDNNKQ